METKTDMKIEKNIAVCPECQKELTEDSGICMTDGCAFGKKVKTDGISHNRFDTADAPRWMTERFQRTPEGFLKGRAVITSIGVFSYRNADGSVQKELRLPEEVFDLESLETLKLKPLTNNHPTAGTVTPENVQTLQVGSLGDNPSRFTDGGPGSSMSDITDGIHVAIDMIVTEQNAIQDVMGGKRSLSSGYTCELEPAPAGSVFMGMEYNFIQRRIRYNHVAIVDVARAGDSARIRLDSGDAVQVEQIKEATTMALKKINLDGVEYEAEAKVLETLNQVKEKADGLTKTVSTLEAERDSLKDRATQLETELTKVKNDSIDQTKVDALVSAKLALLSAALKAGVEAKADQADIEIQKAVITKVFPAAKLDGKDAVYVQVRFDAAMEQLEVETAADSKTRQASAPQQKNDASDEATSAKEKFIARLREDSRK